MYMLARPNILLVAARIHHHFMVQTRAEPAASGIRLGRPGAGDRYVASPGADNRSAADDSGSELVSQVA